MKVGRCEQLLSKRWASRTVSSDMRKMVAGKGTMQAERSALKYASSQKTGDETLGNVYVFKKGLAELNLLFVYRIIESLWPTERGKC